MHTFSRRGVLMADRLLKTDVRTEGVQAKESDFTLCFIYYDSLPWRRLALRTPLCKRNSMKFTSFIALVQQTKEPPSAVTGANSYCWWTDQ